MKTALITGITGQDGSYLADFLLEKGYEVHGVVRRVALEDPENRLTRIKHLRNRIQLHAASLESYPSICRVLSQVKPREIYHLAAQSFVGYSFEDEFSTMSTNINGTHLMLSAFKDIVPEARFYFAASSEMFGNTPVLPQDETTPFHPRSAYGISKVAGFELTQNYREAYDLFASSGILYNHESPRRGFEFVSRKITSQAARIKMGLASQIFLGNLEAKRDWGHAKKYVPMMWVMLQKDQPDDYVISTGETHSVKDFLSAAFDYLGLDYRDYLMIDKDLLRPSDVYVLVGNSAKAARDLGWKYDLKFEDLVIEMVENDLNLLRGKGTLFSAAKEG